MGGGNIGMNMHNLETISVEARDITTFWTIRLDVKDKYGNIFAVDLYVDNFDEETMKRHATALQQGADKIRELFKAKRTPCKSCKGTGDCGTCEGTRAGKVEE
jgi:hypothetical protein